MNKLLAFSGAAAVLLIGSFASAQTYSYQYGYPYSSQQCVTITRDLSVGARGTDVSQLQTFLVAQNYPGSGSWMVTGYYGTATQAAVRLFQQQRGLPQTGIVDAATRAALANCGGSYQFPYYGQMPQYPQYYYPGYSTLSLYSLTPNSGPVGTQVTVYGTGFQTSGNTVYVGSYPLTNIPSYNGTSLSFIVPTYVSGSVQVYVTNALGTSNALTFSVTGGTSGCTGYGFGYPCPVGAPHISYLSPQQGGVGTQVTVFGSGFSRTGNSVRFGNGVIADLNSFDGTSLTFTVPSQISGFGSQPLFLGTYNVSVTNALGLTSNMVPFTVTSLGTAGAPQITSVTGPTTLSTYSIGTWTVTVNAPVNTYTTLSVLWGDEGQFGTLSTQPQTQTVYGTQTFTFTHAYAQPGTYTVRFTARNQFGQENTSTATVTVSGTGSTGTIALNSIAPMSGPMGTQVVLFGSGFTAYDNTVHFGSGGQRNVASFGNGTFIIYTIPAWISPCDPNAPVCTAQAIPVTPGTYPIRVSNGNGQTGTINFTVTN